MNKNIMIAVLCTLFMMGCGSKNPMAPNVANKPQLPNSNASGEESVFTCQESIPGERFIGSHSLSGLKVYAYYNSDEKTDYLILKNRLNSIIRYEKMPDPGIAHHGLSYVRIQSVKFSQYGTFVAIFLERMTIVKGNAVIVYNSQGEKKYTFDRTTEILDHGRIIQINNYNFSSQGLHPRRATLNVDYQKYNYYYDPVKHQEHWILDETVNSLSHTMEF